jgi:ArsR family transcriptional regulator
MFKPKLETEVHQLHAEICAALADPSRILMLYALASRPRSVSELCADLQLEQPRLAPPGPRERGLVTATRSGPTSYTGSPTTVSSRLDLLRGVLRDSLYRRGELAQALSQN